MSDGDLRRSPSQRHVDTGTVESEYSDTGHDERRQRHLHRPQLRLPQIRQQECPRLMPDLSQSASLKGNDPSQPQSRASFCKTLRPPQSTPEPLSPAMPSFSWQLTDHQVPTYVRKSFGNRGTLATSSDARNARRDLQRPGGLSPSSPHRGRRRTAGSRWCETTADIVSI
jgi:hypothetical protein